MHQHNSNANTNSKPNYSYLIWVLGALALSAVNLNEFISTQKLSRAVQSISWLCWAFSWYSRPIFVLWSKKSSESLQIGTLHPKVSELVWVSVTSFAALLMLFGIALKFLFGA